MCVSNALPRKPLYEFRAVYAMRPGGKHKRETAFVNLCGVVYYMSEFKQRVSAGEPQHTLFAANVHTAPMWIALMTQQTT